MVKLKEVLEKNSFRIVDELPNKGEVSLRLGENMNCPILESLEENREEISLILKETGYRTMIRQKDNGICQFIIRG